MRGATWSWLCRNVPEGSILPRRLILARWLLFPLDTAYWKLSRERGYQPETRTWKIRGKEYSEEFFCVMEQADGEVFRVRASDRGCSFERVLDHEQFA